MDGPDLINDLFQTNSDAKIDVQFEMASNAAELSSLLCRVMILGYELLDDGPEVFKRMGRMGVRVHCDVLADVNQLASFTDDENDIKNHKFIVHMSDGSSLVVWFELHHNV